jgi:hypothetical protein
MSADRSTGSAATGDKRGVYESAWSAKALDSSPDAGEDDLPDKSAPGAEASSDEAESAGGLRRLWKDHAAEIVLGAGAFILLLGLLLAFLGIRAEQSSDNVTPEELARTEAGLKEDRKVVAAADETVDTYLVAVEEFMLLVAQLEALSSQELAKSEETAAAFGADLQTFNTLINERNAILSQINLTVEGVRDAAQAVDEAFTELEKLGKVAGRARKGGDD